MKKDKKGRLGLTPHQLALVETLFEEPGLTYEGLARRRAVSVNTVRSHLAHIYAILNINTRAELLYIWRYGQHPVTKEQLAAPLEIASKVYING